MVLIHARVIVSVGDVMAFQRSLNRRPLLTQVVATGAICGAGDVCCQLVLERRTSKTYDVYRTGRFFVLGSFFITPALNRWFKVLEKINGNPKLDPLKRMLVDQFAFAPFFNAVILFNLRILEGYGIEKSWSKMKEDWWTIYSTSLKIWPAVQLANFYLIPLNMRVIVVQSVALFWNTYLSFKTQKRMESDEHTSMSNPLRPAIEKMEAQLSHALCEDSTARKPEVISV
ncbi:Mpv17 / PMP22 family protein [Cooperia oncophora]